MIEDIHPWQFHGLALTSSGESVLPMSPHSTKPTGPAPADTLHMFNKKPHFAWLTLESWVSTRVETFRGADLSGKQHQQTVPGQSLKQKHPFSEHTKNNRIVVSCRNDNVGTLVCFTLCLFFGAVDVLIEC